MFKFNPSPTFTADVKVPVPGAEQPAVLTLTFKHMGRAGVKNWVTSSASAPDEVMLGQVIESWRGVEGDTGAPVPFNAENLAHLLDAYPGAGSAIFDAYLAQLSGGREKN